jgi:hypothetical protein
MSRPYLSAVVATRNDSHGGNSNERLRFAMSHFLASAKKHGVSAEYIVVDWNPPPKKPLMEEVIRGWKLPAEGAAVRVVTVPPSLHNEVGGAKALSFYQMIAKNVGIRRAQGEFILATNIDVLLSEALWKKLKERRFSSRRMYRSDRVDVESSVLSKNPAALEEHKLFWATTRIHRRTSTLSLKLGLPMKMLEIYVSRPNNRRKELRERIRLWLRKLRLPSPFRFRYLLHTNACGDFTLLHTNAWKDLHGYPEFPVFSFHLDSILCLQAHENGYREKVVPFPGVHFHIDHGHGWTPETGEALFKKLKRKKIPTLLLDYQEYEEICRTLPVPILFNPPDWGFGDTKISDTRVL